MLITNSPDFRDLIAKNDKLFESCFEIKVFGKFDEEKLKSIRQGAVIKGKKMGPFFVV
jgi:16S rRNA U516 pseudouridylate synthase RsuA-like enzyme